MDELTLAVVGIDFPNANGSNRRFELIVCRPGEPIELVPEPKNEHDENAIAVFSARGVQIGYLTAERAPWIGRRLRLGEEVAVQFQGMQGSAAYVRARFGGGEPTLPPAPVGEGPAAAETAKPRRPAHRSSDDFYPDPEGPEWGA